jgi:hypothetical protein
MNGSQQTSDGPPYKKLDAVAGQPVREKQTLSLLAQMREYKDSLSEGS